MVDNDNQILREYLGSEERVVIPNEIIKIAEKAFYANRSIKEVIFHGKVEKLDNRSFERCYNLEKVVFRKLENHMNNGSNVFRNCPKLKEMHFLDWESFWNYTYDTFGPLENGTDLYIDNEKVKKIIICSNAKELKNLVGIRNEITGIFFDDGAPALSFHYDGDSLCNYVIKKSYVDAL